MIALVAIDASSAGQAWLLQILSIAALRPMIRPQGGPPRTPSPLVIARSTLPTDCSSPKNSRAPRSDGVVAACQVPERSGDAPRSPPQAVMTNTRTGRCAESDCELVPADANHSGPALPLSTAITIAPA